MPTRYSGNGINQPGRTITNPVITPDQGMFGGTPAASPSPVPTQFSGQTPTAPGRNLSFSNRGANAPYSTTGRANFAPQFPGQQSQIRQQQSSANLTGFLTGIQKQQTGSGFGGMFESLLAEYKKAQEEARKANEGRYEEARELMKGMGEQERKDINTLFEGRQSTSAQDMVSRGLTATTIKPGVAAGIDTQRTDSLGRLEERLRREQAGIIERRQDLYPDMGQLLQLAMSFGAGGGGRGGGGSFRLGGNRGGGESALDRRNREIRAGRGGGPPDSYAQRQKELEPWKQGNAGSSGGGGAGPWTPGGNPGGIYSVSGYPAYGGGGGGGQGGGGGNINSILDYVRSLSQGGSSGGVPGGGTYYNQ